MATRTIEEIENQEQKTAAEKQNLVNHYQVLQAENERLRHKLAKLDAILSESKPETRQGWIIVAPNKQYSGVTVGIKFQHGLGWLPVETANVDRLVIELDHDYGYNLVRATKSEFLLALDQAAAKNGKPDDKVTLADLLSK